MVDAAHFQPEGRGFDPSSADVVCAFCLCHFQLFQLPPTSQTHKFTINPQEVSGWVQVLSSFWSRLQPCLHPGTAGIGISHLLWRWWCWLLYSSLRENFNIHWQLTDTLMLTGRSGHPACKRQCCLDEPSAVENRRDTKSHSHDEI